MYKLIEFTNEREYINLFLSLPTMIYIGDKNYIPERTTETIAWMAGNRKFKRFLKQKNMLVLNDGSPVARGIAFINTIGNFGSIGFFECIEDEQAVKLIADATKLFCRENGIQTIFAPMNGSIWSSYRLMTKGFEDRPFIGEPYNKPYYSDLLIKCGFISAKKWQTQFVKKIKVKDETANKYIKLEKSLYSNGINVRKMKNFDDDIRIIYKLVMNSFQNFFLFNELNEQEFVDSYADLRLICDRRTIRIAFNSKNQPIGFGIALPDYRNKLGFLLRYAKRYVFIYLGTLQENGESVYPQCGKAIIVSILRSLFLRQKGYVRAMMSDDAKTRNFSNEFQNLHEYTLFKMEVD